VTWREYPDAPDALLVKSALGGDKSSFAVLVGRHMKMARSVTLRLLRDRTLVADVLQEATVAALIGLPRLRSPERFGSWYAGIALNVARRLLREVAIGPLCGDVVDGGAAPDDQAEAAEVAQRVRDAVRDLPFGQREAVLAFYWQGLSHAEAARELGIRPGAVKARLHQARENLTQTLSDLIDETEEVAVSPIDDDTYVEASLLEVRSLAADDPVRRTHAVTLEETSGDRRLVIFVGAPEGRAMVSTLQSIEFPRPMTYQLCVSLVEATKATITEVRITDFTELTYLAEIVLGTPAGVVQIDARPSDALNVALIAEVPIRISESLLTAWASQLMHIPQSTIEEAIGGSLEGHWETRWQQPPTLPD
jgi:RNA polymerase sigma factor (sigma-70 family)